jgi:hypothetical protein
MAVGPSGDLIGARAQARRWNGRKWTVAAAVNLPAAGNSLASVSCTSKRACTAVGSTSYLDQTLGYVDAPLIERWDGKTWSVQPALSPAGAASANLDGVSCTSSRVCTAVGRAIETIGGFSWTAVAIIERWNGSSWSLQDTMSVSPPGSTLFGVSCVPGTACVAVGDGPLGTVVQRWDGASWALQPSPNAHQPADSILFSVSCGSERACMAAGYSEIASSEGNVVVPLAERYA